jgi:F-type H+-transporting ATPase subunit gamma
MPNLKDLKTRIDSVKSTQKITSAMKLVAAAKLRRAQEMAEASRPYSLRMNDVIASLASKADPSSAPELLVGRPDSKTHLLVVMSSDKGLCGGFNAFITRAARQVIAEKQQNGQTVLIYVVGRKSADALGAEIADKTFQRIEGVQGTNVAFGDADDIAQKIMTGFEQGTFDSVSMLYNKFVSVIKQDVTHQSLIPAEVGDVADDTDATSGAIATYEYEPDEEEILNALLPRNVATQIFSALLESSASELAARMTAMDNATRNAGDMIDRLTLVYNRTRQANITKELIEIISGAEAL